MTDDLIERLNNPRWPNMIDMQEAAKEIQKLKIDLAYAKHKIACMKADFEEATRRVEYLSQNNAVLRCDVAAALDRMSKLDFERTAAELRAGAAEADLAAAREQENELQECLRKASFTVTNPSLLFRINEVLKGDASE